ncbi:MAG: endo-1,4-beta-xylanase [Victivallales bacterium]|nr:endo-1,4-beta-xylanase [Victivallales bacterium]
MKRPSFLLPLMLSGIVFLSASLIAQQGVNVIVNGGFNSDNGKLSGWSFRNSQKLGSYTIVPGEEGQPNILRAVCRNASPRPWGMELFQNIETKIGQASVVHVSFEYRISEGYSFNFYWQEERSPWPKLLSLHLDSPSDSWQTIQMAVPIHATLFAGSSSFSFHLAEKPGICELRNVSAVVYPEGTNPDTLATNTQPVLGGDFYDKDWREHAQNTLKATRTVNLEMLVSRAGKPVPEAQVTVSQTGRRFRFGIETPAALLLPEALSAKENAELNQRVVDSADRLPQLKAFLLDTSMFQQITFTDVLLWRDYDAWGHQYDQAAIKLATEAGLAVNGHALYVPAFMFAPVACRKMSRFALSRALQKHITDLTERHRGAIASWEVIYGGTDYQEIYDFIGINSMLEAWKTAREKDEQVALYLSEPHALSASNESQLRDCIELASWLQQSGVKLSGIVLGANMKRLEVAPQSMERRLNEISRALKLPIHIAEFAVNEENDAVQAAELADYLLLFFSHSAVASVTFAQPWAKALPNPNLALLKEDLTPRASAALVRDLLTRKWLTNVQTSTGEDGTLALECFRGTHEVTVTAGDKTAKLHLDLNEDPLKVLDGPAQFRRQRQPPARVLTINLD